MTEYEIDDVIIIIIFIITIEDIWGKSLSLQHRDSRQYSISLAANVLGHTWQNSTFGITSAWSIVQGDRSLTASATLRGMKPPDGLQWQANSSKGVWGVGG